jgi:hypothetical protein
MMMQAMMWVIMLVQVIMQAISDGSVRDNQYVDNSFSTPNIICHINVP